MLAKKYMDAGDLVPDEVTSAMVAARLEESDADAGLPARRLPAHRAAGRVARRACWTSAATKLDAVLLLEAPDDVLLERMLARGRADDTAEAIARRLALYHSRDHAAARALRDARWSRSTASARSTRCSSARCPR